MGAAQRRRKSPAPIILRVARRNKNEPPRRGCFPLGAAPGAKPSIRSVTPGEGAACFTRFVKFCSWTAELHEAIRMASSATYRASASAIDFRAIDMPARTTIAPVSSLTRIWPQVLSTRFAKSAIIGHTALRSHVATVCVDETTFSVVNTSKTNLDTEPLPKNAGPHRSSTKGGVWRRRDDV